MGWKTVFNCEINPFGQRVLKYHWPNAKLYEDIKKTDFKKWAGQIYILTNSFPCQPFSVAGKRKGTDDNRYLWEESLRAICEVQPEWAVSENVPGLITWSKGMVFDKVQADLEDAGYEVIPFVLPAASVNAPHKRERIWFVAHAINSGYRTKRGQNGKEDGISGINRTTLCTRVPIGADSGITADTRLLGSKGTRQQATGTKQCSERNASNTTSRESGQSEAGNWRESFITRSKEVNDADFNEPGLEGTDSERNASTRGWIMQHPGFDRFPTESPLCSRDDGISTRLDGITFPKWRNESIKAYGNAIVPQVALQILKAIEKFDNE
jgi:DNA (cytosine-5)-methyltransferase 1